jgi:hypothetical protein
MKGWKRGLATVTDRLFETGEDKDQCAIDKNANQDRARNT